MADRLELLRDLAPLLWDSILNTPDDKRAPLAAQYRATLAEIAELEHDAGKVADPVDEIAARRSARGAASSAPRQHRAAADPS